MAAPAVLPAFVVGIALTFCIFLPTPCLAQATDAADSAASESARELAAAAALAANVDAPECPNLTIFPKLPGSVVLSCHTAESVEVTMPLQPDVKGLSRQKSVRGKYEQREYRITQATEQEQVFQNLLQFVPMSGFTVKYAVKPATITARNGDTWLLLNINGDFYNLSVVHETEQPWSPVKSAEEISRQMAARNYVSIYGIQFSPGNQTIQADGGMLNEILKYLKENPNLAVVIESHKVSSTGTAEADLEITKKRAAAVVDWLVSHGIAPARLQPKPLGRTKPITENDTAIEIQRNERIAIAKGAS